MSTSKTLPLRYFSRFSDHTKYRLLEIIPGALVWLTILLALVLSFSRPLWAIIFIIVFDLYWLTRVVYVLIYLTIAFRRYRRESAINWLSLCQSLPDWRRLHHLVFLPTAGEPLDVLQSTLRSLAHVRYPADRFLVVLATEARFAGQVQTWREILEQEFSSCFARFIITSHPSHLPGEVIGKGSNLAWTGKQVQRLIDEELKIPYENIAVSSFDIDTRPHPEYFGCLAYHYLTHPHPTRTSFQPVPLYNNNLWQSPAIMRVAANSTTFWLMSEQARPERLLTFSSHSMSFQALVDVGYWQSDVVSEDSRIFLQALLRYDGDYTVTPIYIPVSMDTVLGKNLWRSLVNLYKQQRRWAYGVENFPYMVWNFSQNRLISRSMKIRFLWNQLEGSYSWAVAPILIFLLGFLPLRVGADSLGTSILAQNAPAVLQVLMSSAMIGLLVSAILSTHLLPPRPVGFSRMKIFLILFQWILFPITMILFGSVPATDAQTRLMFGKYLGFWVTEKGMPHRADAVTDARAP